MNAISRYLAAAIAKQDAMNEGLRACVQAQRECNRQQVEINADVR
jgi:hypothetical protein